MSGKTFRDDISEPGEMACWEPKIDLDAPLTRAERAALFIILAASVALVIVMVGTFAGMVYARFF